MFLRDQQTKSRKDRSCADQITTQQIIVEQSTERDSSLCINFLDFEKAFDFVDNNTLWSLLQNNGVLEREVSIIKNSYEGLP